MYYFKDDGNGVGMSDNQNIPEVTWITEEEYRELLEIHRAARREREAALATEG